jgi:hypothetical protein
VDLLMLATAFIGGIGCLVMHPGWGRVIGLIGPTIAFTNVQLLGQGEVDTWTYTGVNLAAAIAGGWAFGYGRIAKLRAIADAD